MHELSLVCSILDLAEAEARAAGAKVINGITVEIGALAGVETEALAYCFQTARRHTMAAAAELVIEEVPGRGFCTACGRESAAASLMAVCEYCVEGVLTICQGREMRLSTINVD